MASDSPILFGFGLNNCHVGELVGLGWIMGGIIKGGFESSRGVIGR